MTAGSRRFRKVDKIAPCQVRSCDRCGESGHHPRGSAELNVLCLLIPAAVRLPAQLPAMICLPTDV